MYVFITVNRLAIFIIHSGSYSGRELIEPYPLPVLYICCLGLESNVHVPVLDPTESRLERGCTCNAVDGQRRLHYAHANRFSE
jgi:hypothetical protein